MILDMPKSPTRALMSSARRMLLGLKITMNYEWLTIVVQIFYRIHNIDSNLKPLGKAERVVCTWLLRFSVKPTIQIAIGHELKDQCLELLTLMVDAGTRSNDLYETTVSYPPHGLTFSLKTLGIPGLTKVKHLDSQGSFPIGQNALENCTITSSPEQILI
jgi:hypothetical protein